jgi:hypothetical protein
VSSEEESVSGSVSVSESDDNLINNDSSLSEKTPLLVGVGQASPSLYQSFVRFIANEDLFARFIFFVLCTPVNSNSLKAEILKAFSKVYPRIYYFCHCHSIFYTPKQDCWR